MKEKPVRKMALWASWYLLIVKFLFQKGHTDDSQAFRILKLKSFKVHVSIQILGVLLSIEASGHDEGPACLPQMISPLCRSWTAPSREVIFVTLVYFMYQPLTFFLNNILYYLPLFSNLPTPWPLCRHLASWKWASFWLDLTQVPVSLGLVDPP